MNEHELKGAVRHVTGRAESAIGSVVGDLGQQAQGAYDQIAGGVQNAYGRASDRADDLIAQGDALARDAARYTNDVVDRSADFARDAQRTSVAYARQATRYADEHRVLTLLGVAVAGFVLGWMSRSST